MARDSSLTRRVPMSRYFLISLVTLALAIPGFGESFKKTHNVLPAFEGIYQVWLECLPGETSTHCNRLPNVSRMVVIDTGTLETGVSLSFVDRTTNQPHYLFSVTEAQEGGGLIEGNSFAFKEKLAEIHVEMNRDRNTLTGWIRDPEFRLDLKVTGAQLSSLGTLHKKEALPELSANVVAGVYIGTMGKRMGYLTLRKVLTSSEQDFLGTFVDNVTGERKDFAISQFFSRQRVVTLLSREQGKYPSMMKWTLVHEIDENSLASLNGVSYSSTSGQMLDLNFKRLDPTP
jgi:hypothetical protein